jgi:hypothetical protein
MTSGAKALLSPDCFVRAEILTHNPWFVFNFWTTAVGAVLRIVFVGRGFSRDIREFEKWGLQSLCGNARMFVGRGPGRAGIFDFSHDINAAE